MRLKPHIPAPPASGNDRFGAQVLRVGAWVTFGWGVLLGLLPLMAILAIAFSVFVLLLVFSFLFTLLSRESVDFLDAGLLWEILGPGSGWFVVIVSLVILAAGGVLILRILLGINRAWTLHLPRAAPAALAFGLAGCALLLLAALPYLLEGTGHEPFAGWPFWLAWALFLLRILTLPVGVVAILVLSQVARPSVRAALRSPLPATTGPGAWAGDAAAAARLR